jgi:hypothetical protein
MTSAEVSLRCRCGGVRGVARDLSARLGNRVVCYCDDCQAYARWLGGEGLVDAYGGTDVFQMAPARLRLEGGAEELRCVRLAPKGLLRWYAGCCRTPVGNTLGSPRVPFVGVVRAFMDHAADDRTRDEALGPPLASIFGEFAAPGAPPGVRARAPRSLLVRSARLLLVAWLRGDARPSPFFDSTGAPVSEPLVLGPQEREALRSHAAAPAGERREPPGTR